MTQQPRHPLVMQAPASGRPPVIKERIAVLFADGRERTVDDVFCSLGATTGAQRDRIRLAMRQMTEAGLLRVEYVGGIGMWSREEVPRPSVPAREAPKPRKHFSNGVDGGSIYVFGDLTESQLATLRAMTRPEMTAREINEAAGLNDGAQRSRLISLKFKGYVRSGWRRGARIWTLTEGAA